MSILITGATGFIGLELVNKLIKNQHKVILITRDKLKAQKQISYPVDYIEWDLNASSLKESPLFNDVEVVIHLAGENIGKGRWTQKKQTEIMQSRNIVTKNLVSSFNSLPNLKTFISASAIGFYGNTGNEWVDETHSCGQSFLAKVCEEWENSLKINKTSNSKPVRTIIFRFGIVLGESGGMLPQITKIFKSRLGAPLGKGSQWMSWIHIDDLTQLIIESLNESLHYEGVYNAVSPNPVTNFEFSSCLAKVLKVMMLPSVPEFVLRWTLGEKSQLLLESQRISSKKIENLGFKFKYAKLDSALNNILI